MLLLQLLILLYFSIRLKDKLFELFRLWEFWTMALVQILVFSIQIGLIQVNVAGPSLTRPALIAVFLSYLPLILKFDLYKAVFLGSISTILGTILNNYVIAQNNGFMPVYPTLSHVLGHYQRDPVVFADGLHILADQSTKCFFLCDYIDLGYMILSPGDILIHSFGGFVLYFALKKIYSDDS